MKRRTLVLEVYGNICWLCENPIDVSLKGSRAGLDASVDHVIPKRLRRYNGLWNLRPAHRVCNSQRDRIFPQTVTAEYLAWFEAQRKRWERRARNGKLPQL